MKVGCRPIIFAFRIELSPNPPCIATLKTEMFDSFIFKDAQATKSHNVGIKSTNSICCKMPKGIPFSPKDACIVDLRIGLPNEVLSCFGVSIACNI
ncbi:hypothetical protein BT93_D2042 [Corymbia citriodora subsp. variegata]|nr:hypothetical protein BT93_D2042 [Corymbia citriodora subsp. variegata]